MLSFFFFKQKTAYEMRISDWISDVGSSDLFDLGALIARLNQRREQRRRQQQGQGGGGQIGLAVLAIATRRRHAGAGGCALDRRGRRALLLPDRRFRFRTRAAGGCDRRK